MIKGALKLVRLSALPSAWADQFGGMALALFVAGNLQYEWHPGKILWLLLASFGVYLGGMALNDVLHVRKDRLLGKQRPIVTGEVTLSAAWGVTLALFAIGALGGFMAGVLVPVLVLTVLIFLYNHLAAGRVVGVKVVHSKARACAAVFVIALCRAVHVLLPLAAHAGLEKLQLAPNEPVILLFASSVFVYFCIVTVISLFEDSGGGRRSLLVVSFLLLPVVFALPMWLLVQPGEAPLVLGLIVPLLILAALLVGLWRKLDAARKEPIPPKLGACVGAGIRGEALLMAGFALMLAAHEPWWGLAALACFPASLLLAKWISPT